MENRTAPDLFEQAANQLSDLLVETIARRQECTLVVSGGKAIRQTLVNLSTCEVPWSSVRIYLADERCVPQGDKDRNDSMVDEVFVRPSGINTENFIRIPAELGPVLGAYEYSRTIAEINQFDIALLGVGEDGHVASLFPNHPSVLSRERVVAVKNSPKIPPNRVSLGLTMLRGATHRIVVVAGVEKSDLIARIQEGQRPPVALIDPTGWFLDPLIVDFRVDGSTITQQGQPK